MQPDRRLRLADPSSIVSFAFLVLISLTLTAVPLRSSHDEWWHLKTGRWIDEHGLPKNDIFTYTAEDIPWHNHEWLAQVLLWRIFRAGESAGVGGVRAVIFFKSLFVTLTFAGLALFMARRTGAPAISALAAALACGLARRTLYPRPPFITYGFLAFVLCYFIAWRSRKLRSAWLLLLPPIFALWANLHGGFIAGLVVVGAFWGEAVADLALAHWRMEEARGPRRPLTWITAILGLCALATLGTPFGYHLYELAGRVMSDKQLEGTIGELLPPDWRFVWMLDGCILVMLFAAVRPRSLGGAVATCAAAAILFFLLQGWVWMTAPASEVARTTTPWDLWLREALALSIFLIAAARSKKDVGLAQTMLLLFFTHQAIHHVRHLPLLAVVLTPVMAQTLTDWIRSTVGGWDWLWRIKNRDEASPEYQSALRARRLRLGSFASVALLALLAAFYLFLPEEAVWLVTRARSGAPLNARATQRLLDRNLMLLRDDGGDPRVDRGTEPGAYPKAAVDFLLDHNLPGHLWNGGNYAGYLIWRLAPEHYKVFTDNRYDIYGGQFIQQERIVLQAFEGDAANAIPDWKTVLRNWDVKTLFIPQDAPLQQILTREEQENRSGAQWWQVWNDLQFAIWTSGRGTD